MGWPAGRISWGGGGACRSPIGVDNNMHRRPFEGRHLVSYIKLVKLWLWQNPGFDTSLVETGFFTGAELLNVS